jgi:L-rhamnonate dehydratase
MTEERVVRIEWGLLEGQRPRVCGKNARLKEHGSIVRVPLCRLTSSDGAQGIGLSRLDEATAALTLGLSVADYFDEGRGADGRGRDLDHALYDLSARRSGVPVHRLVQAGPAETATQPRSVACYDTCLYFDDLLVDAGERDHQAAAAVVATEAARDYDVGHRAFKVKVGRGARWMDTQEGLDRDVAVVRAVRDAVGPECTLLVDANNGFTFNLAVRFLERTGDLRIEWLEEPFHEDAVLLEALKQWVTDAGLGVALADCEDSSVQNAVRLAQRGLLDVIQCDILGATFAGWLELGAALDKLGIASAPHHFGLHLGNYVTGHLSGALTGLRYIEWDECRAPGIFPCGYTFHEGRLQLSEEPGFGIELDEEQFRRAVRATGFDVGCPVH